MNQKITEHYIKTLTTVLPLKKTKICKDEIIIITHYSYLLNILLFLKLHNLCQYKILTCISCVDFPKKQHRFEIIYELLSIKFNHRLKIKIIVNQLQFLESCENIYLAANWFECEIFDMFGIFFINHSNLKRILTDYGFEGYPLRKDFPLSGYIELRYDERNKKIISEYIELAQEYRTFDFYSPWNLK